MIDLYFFFSCSTIFMIAYRYTLNYIPGVYRKLNVYTLHNNTLFLCLNILFNQI
ncbi:hypothetical protein BJ944DRAFT_259186 [Cunninghamella echinulata]|nr:hypothetical protein BJ944DRAFT_259186 [Cunninghamella echinulata]